MVSKKKSNRNVTCNLCLDVLGKGTTLAQHHQSSRHQKMMRRKHSTSQFLSLWEKRAQSNPNAPKQVCIPCHIAMGNDRNFKLHMQSKKHVAQVKRANTYAALIHTIVSDADDVDFGILDIRDSAPPLHRDAVVVTNTSNTFAVTLLAVHRGGPGRPSINKSVNPSPFSVSIAAPLQLLPGGSLPIPVSFAQQGLPKGHHFEQVVLEFSGTADGSSPPDSVTVTLKATLTADPTLVRKLAPVEDYSRRNPHDSFRDRVIIPGVRPPMMETPYRIKLGSNKIPKDLMALFGRPHNEQFELSPLKGLRLTPSTYSTYFSTLTHAEEYQMNLDIREFDMHGATLAKTKGGASFVLVVPGLAERRPSVLYGDHVFLMASGDAAEGKKWQGFAHEVREAQVVLHFNAAFGKQWVQGSKWDVRFSFSRTALQRMHDAVKRVAGGGTGVNGDWTQRLFPMRPVDEAKEAKRVEVARTMRALKIADRKLEKNDEQRRAVAMVLSGVHGPVPLLVFGPPGTGKTSTIIECIYQLLRNPTQVGKPVRILATAPSNASADLILQRLSQYFDKTQMFRLNAPSRSTPLIDDSLTKYCRTDRSFGRPLWSVPTLDELRPFKIIVSTCGAAGILFGVGGAELGFTHVFVDEAGQALEPEVVLALQVLLDNPEGRIILSGDPYQLGPIIRSPVAKRLGYNVSLLERLVMTASDVPEGRRCYSVRTDDPADFSDLYGVLLRKNYRSHPSILTPPNTLFYRSRLIAAADPVITHSLATHPVLPTRDFPMIFHQVHGKDFRESSSPSWFNPLEVTAVVHIVKRLLSERGPWAVRPGDIGIIAPYRKQVAKIRTAIADIPSAKEGVTVGTTEFFQGSEKRIIIVSTVRATPERVAFDLRHALGFVGDAKRFNVATTRAKAMLCVVGDARVLFEDRCWKEWIGFVRKNGGWVGDKVEVVEEMVREMVVEEVEEEEVVVGEDEDVKELVSGVQGLSVEEDADGKASMEIVKGIEIAQVEEETDAAVGPASDSDGELEELSDSLVLVEADEGLLVEAEEQLNEELEWDEEEIVFIGNADLEWREME